MEQTMAVTTAPPAVSTTTDQEVTLNTGSNLSSLRPDCVHVVFSQLDYVPWDNPDNLLSSHTETIVRRIQYNILGLCFLIGCPANVINMAVFYKQGLKDRVNLCLFALSLSDGLFLVTFMVLYGEQLHLQFTTREDYGPMTRFGFNHNIVGFVAFGYVSTLLSAVIAVERCICVFLPLKYPKLIRTRTMGIVIVFIYIVVVGLFIVVVFRYRIGCLYDPTTGEVVTTFLKGQFYVDNRGWIDLLDSVTFGAGLPGTVLVVVLSTTLLTGVKLRQIVSWRADTTSSSSTSSISPKELALTKMLVGNSILFIICFSPDAINHLSRHYIPGMNSGGRWHNFYLVALWLGDIFTFFNATLNIFVYYSMGSRYRETFWALCGRSPKAGRTLSSISDKSVMSSFKA